MPEAGFALLALVVQIPFELRYTFLGLTNLQWTFVLLLILSAPHLLTNLRGLASDAFVRATAIFVGLQWLAAAYAPEFHTNAFKAAARLTIGLLLVLIVKRSLHSSSARTQVMTCWTIASFAAALYAFVDYAGFGLPSAFRTEEFHIGQILRLSGSFEYPTTAAAYFAVSLPIVWWSGFRPVLRYVFAFALLCAIVLTFSKGALVAVPAVLLVTNRKAALPVILMGLAAYFVLLPLNPDLVGKTPLTLEYKTEWNYLLQQPARNDVLAIEIHNTGATLQSRGRQRTSIAYRWWRYDTGHFISSSPIVTQLPRDITHGESLKLDAAFQTPPEPGRYVLVIELFRNDFHWLSQTGIQPAIVQADIRPDVSRMVDNVDLSSIYKRGDDPTILTAAVPRTTLWKAALKMFAAHPFGVGPDNYRLHYGKYLGVSRWNTLVHSNNLYLELLTGSGILGLAAFAYALFRRRWNTDPASVSTAVFLVHSLVDVFIMATPIYFAFWILAATPVNVDAANSPSGSAPSHPA